MIRTRLMWILLWGTWVGCTDVSPVNPFDPATPIEKQARATLVGTVQAEVADPENVSISLPSLGMQRNPGPDGSFEIGNIPPGSHLVQMEAELHQLYRETYYFPPGAQVEVHVSLTGFRGGISGRVTLVGQARHGGVVCRLRRITQGLRSSDPSSERITLSDLDGRFHFSDVPVSTYELSLEKEDFTPNGATGIQIQSDQVKDVGEFEMRPAVGALDIYGGPDFNTPDYDNVHYSRTLEVQLRVYGFNATQMKISEDPEFSDVDWIPYATEPGYTLTSGDGEKVVFVVFLDEDGQKSDVFSGSTILDTTAPDPTFSTFGLAGNKLYSRDPAGLVDLETEGFDATSGVKQMMLGTDPDFSGSTWEAYRQRIPGFRVATSDPGDDGLKRVFIRFRDWAGNQSDILETEIYMDRTKPTCSLQINGGETWATDTSVLLQVDAKDACDTDHPQGCDQGFTSPSEIKVANAMDFGGAMWVSFAPSLSWNLSTGDGDKQVFARVRDEAGNESDPCLGSIQLDTSVPLACWVEVGAGVDWVADATVEVQLACEDASAYALSLDAPPAQPINWTDCPGLNCGTTISTTAFLGDSEGRHTVYIMFRDAGGNLSPVYHDAVQLDLSPPEIQSLTTAAPDGFSDQTSVLILSQVPGATSLKLSEQPDFADIDWEPFASVKTFLLSAGDGNKTVYACFRDQASNLDVACAAGTPDAVQLVLDTHVPTVPSVDSSAAEAYDTNDWIPLDTFPYSRYNLVRLHLTSPSSDATSGLKGYELRLDSGDWQVLDQVTMTAGAQIDLSAPGDHQVSLRAVDLAGNRSAEETLTLTLDQSPPADVHLVNSGSQVYANAETQSVYMDSGQYGPGAPYPHEDPNFATYQLQSESLGGVWTPTAATDGFLFSLVNEAQNNLCVRTVDRAGNQGMADCLLVEEDSTPPIAPVFAPEELRINSTYLDLKPYQLSSDASVANPGTDNLSHYEVSGGQDCNTMMDNVFRNIGPDPHQRVCLQSAGTPFPFLSDRTYSIEIYAVDRAGNRSAPARLSVHQAATRTLSVDDSSSQNGVSAGASGISSKMENQRLFTNYWSLQNSTPIPLREPEENGILEESILGMGMSGENLIVETAGDAVDSSSKGTSVVLKVYKTNSQWELGDYPGFDVILHNPRQLFGYSSISDIRTAYSSDGPLLVYHASYLPRVDDFGLTTGSELLANDSCLGNIYQATRDVHLLGFWQEAALNGDLRTSLLGLIGVRASTLGDGNEFQKDYTWDMQHLSRPIDRDPVASPQGWIYVPMTGSGLAITTGSQVFLGICDLHGTLSANFQASPGSAELAGLSFVRGAGYSYPVMGQPEDPFVVTPAASPRLYRQRVITLADQLVNHEAVVLYDGSRSRLPLTGLFTQDEIHVLDSVDTTVNGFEQVLARDQVLSGTDQMRGVQLDLNGDFGVPFVRCYLNCSADSGTVQAAVYSASDPDGPYTLRGSGSASSVVGYNAYSISPGVPVMQNPQHVLVACLWEGVTCQYETGASGSLPNPVDKPYGQLVAGVGQDGVSVFADSLSIPTFSRFDYPIHIGLQLSTDSGMVIGGDTDVLFDVKGRYLAWSMIDQDGTGRLRVMDLGPDLGYDGEVPVTLWSGTADLADLVLGTWGLAYVLCSGESINRTCDLVIHDFGPDRIPQADGGDDQLVTSPFGGTFDSGTLMWTAPGHLVLPGGFLSSTHDARFYNLDSIFKSGNNWLESLTPAFSLRLTGTISASDIYAFDQAASAQTGINHNELLVQTGVQLHPAAAQPVDSKGIMQLEPDYSLSTQFDFNGTTPTSNILAIPRSGGLARTACQGASMTRLCWIARQWGGYVLSMWMNFETGVPGLMVWDPERDQSLELSSMSPAPVGEGLHGVRWLATDGSLLMYTGFPSVPGQVEVHLYDLGADGLHQDDTGVADPGEDAVAPFPLILNTTEPSARMELDGDYFALDVKNGSSWTVVYGKLGDPSPSIIPTDARLAGIEDGTLAYVTGENQPQFHVLDLSNANKATCPLPRGTGLSGKPWGKMGKMGDWYVFGVTPDWSQNQLILMLNPFVGTWVSVAGAYMDYLAADGFSAPDMENNTVLFTQDLDGIPQLYTLTLPQQ